MVEINQHDDAGFCCHTGKCNEAHGDGDIERAVSWRVPLANFPAGTPQRRLVEALLHPDAWLLVSDADVGGHPTVRVAHAVAEISPAKRKALLLSSFRYYAAAAERAQDEDWPDDACKNWRYRRATLARLLAHDGMMQQVADAYTQVRAKWQPHAPTWPERLRASLGL